MCYVAMALGRARAVMNTRAIVFAVVFAGVAAAAAGFMSCGCGASAQSTIIRQGPPAAACLPVYLPLIIDCANKHDMGCAILNSSQLVACWVQHEPAPLPAAPSSGSGSGS